MLRQKEICQEIIKQILCAVIGRVENNVNPLHAELFQCALFIN